MPGRATTAVRPCAGCAAFMALSTRSVGACPACAGLVPGRGLHPGQAHWCGPAQADRERQDPSGKHRWACAPPVPAFTKVPGCWGWEPRGRRSPILAATDQAGMASPAGACLLSKIAASAACQPPPLPPAVHGMLTLLRTLLAQYQARQKHRGRQGIGPCSLWSLFSAVCPCLALQPWTPIRSRSTAPACVWTA